jgi:hypothetical protein
MSDAGRSSLISDGSLGSGLEGPADSTGGDTTGIGGDSTQSLVQADNDSKASAADGQHSVEQAEGAEEQGKEGQAVVPDGGKGKRLEKQPRREADEKDVSRGESLMDGMGFGGDF